MPKLSRVSSVAGLAPFSSCETLTYMYPSPKNRRQWIASTASATAAAVLLGDFAGAESQSATDPKVLLVADPTRQLHRVRVEMDIEGNINVPKNALVSKEKTAQIPVRSQCVLDWEERVLGFASDRTAHAAQRYYHEAHSSGKVGKKDHQIKLRPQSQSIRIQRQDARWLVYSDQTYLDGQELDLLKVPANSLAIDGLLPTMAVRTGDTYQPDPDVLAKLLSLAAVQESTITGEVVSVESASAKIHFKGKVEGSVGGVPTTIDVVAKLVFDREAAACTWLAVAIREVREIGKSEPGFDVAGTIRMIRKPLDAPVRLPAAAPIDLTAMVPLDRLYTELSSKPVGYAVLMDRRWKIMTDVAGASMMRMIEDDRGIAQCDLRPLGKMAAGSQLTLEAMTQESRTSMGDRFVEVLQAREELNQAGLRVLRVTIQGAVQGVPVQWIFMQFSDDAGRRLLATATVGNEHLDTFAGADEQLCGSLRFLPLDDQTIGVASNRSATGSVK
jgi:hypothetical protein